MGPSIAQLLHPRVAKNRHASGVTFTAPVRPPVVLMTNQEVSDWSPLRRALESELGEPKTEVRNVFRFIGHAAGPDDIGTLHVYRHLRTRRYLVLDSCGRAYRYEPATRCYGRVELREALDKVRADLPRPL